MGVWPELDAIHMIGAFAAVGWTGHFRTGTIACADGFAMVNKYVPVDGQLTKRFLVGIAARFGMIVLVMPMAGAGFFGLGSGITASVMTPILHVVVGAVPGAVSKSVPATAQTAWLGRRHIPGGEATQ